MSCVSVTVENLLDLSAPVKKTPGTMPPTPPPITDSKATEVLIALRYWARSTNFAPNEQEKAVLTECEELSVKLWKVGITVGGLSGLGAATAMKVAMIQTSCGGIGGCVARQRIRPVQGQRPVLE